MKDIMNKMIAIFIMGPVASGKSTIAGKLVEGGNYIEINRDNIRRELLGIPVTQNLWNHYEHNKTIEAQVTKIADTMLVDAANNKKSVIISDTNLFHMTLNRRIKFARNLGYEIEIMRLMGESLDTLLTRNANRIDSVPDFVVRDMWQRTLTMHNAELKWDRMPEKGKSIIVCDIDGTVASKGDRGWFEWEKVGCDKPRHHVIDAVVALSMAYECEIVFVSGRDIQCFDETSNWITEHIGIDEPILFMRPANNYDPDTKIKKTIYDAILRKYHIAAVFDDRPSVVEMWHDLKLPVFAVADQRDRF